MQSWAYAWHAWHGMHGTLRRPGVGMPQCLCRAVQPPPSPERACHNILFLLHIPAQAKKIQTELSKIGAQAATGYPGRCTSAGAGWQGAAAQRQCKCLSAYRA